MRLLYIFPHPDDESFGPAPAISRQMRQGHEVFLLTLTRGGATRMRHELGYSIEEMGEVRLREMECVEKVLNLSGMKVLDLPDSGLKYMDPRILESIIAEEIKRIKPDIVVTYPVHGISGFHDHLVCHQVVKRVFLVLRDAGETYLKRLAFFTISKPENHQGIHKLNWSDESDISCTVTVDEEDVSTFHRALDCYTTYQEIIEQTGVRELIGNQVAFELFHEHFNQPITDLTENLPDD